MRNSNQTDPSQRPVSVFLARSRSVAEMALTFILLTSLICLDRVLPQPTCLLPNEGVLYEPDDPEVEIYDSLEPHCEAPICYTELRFVEMISQGHLIFDKSLLIRAVLSSPHNTILFSFPRKWCKTINVEMIKEFLEIEMHDNGTRVTPEIETNNFRLFKHGRLGKRVKLKNPLLISAHNDLFLKYFGKYPVVYAHLDMYGVTRLSGFHEMLKIFISYTFRRHDYMLDVFQAVKNDTNATQLEKIHAESNYQTFVMYMIRESSGEDLYHCLYFLTEVLYKFHKQKVFLLIDEYDNVINYLVFEYFYDDKYDMIEFYMKFLQHSIVDNPYVEKSIVAGILTLDRCLGPNALKTNFIESPLNPYFGYSEREMHSLYEYLNVSVSQREILREWANGYQVNFTAPHKVYEPRLVDIFLQYRNYEHIHHAVTGHVEVFVPLFIRIPGYQEAAAILMRGGYYTIQVHTVEYSWEKLRFLADCFDNPKPVLRDYPGVDAALHYLLIKGHLTWVHHSTTANTTILSVKIPNKQTLDRLKERFQMEYGEHRFLRIPALYRLPKYLQNATNAFQRYFQTEAESDPQFVSLCEYAIAEIRTTDNITDHVVDEDNIVEIFRKPRYLSPEEMVRSFFYAMVIYTGNFPIHSTRFLPDGPHTPEFIFTHVHHGVLVKVAGLPNITNASTPAPSNQFPRLFDDHSADFFHKLPRFAQIQRVKFVEIHITSGTTFIMRGYSKNITR